MWSSGDLQVLKMRALKRGRDDFQRAKGPNGRTPAVMLDVRSDTCIFIGLQPLRVRSFNNYLIDESLKRMPKITPCKPYEASRNEI